MAFGAGENKSLTKIAERCIQVHRLGVKSLHCHQQGAGPANSPGHSNKPPATSDPTPLSIGNLQIQEVPRRGWDQHVEVRVPSHVSATTYAHVGYHSSSMGSKTSPRRLLR